MAVVTFWELFKKLGLLFILTSSHIGLGPIHNSTIKLFAYLQQI